jgi:hypothetical protein
MTDAWNFAQVDDFWKLYQPLTPWGRDQMELRTVLSDAAILASRYDQIEHAMRWLSESSADPLAADRMAYHLKRMPRIPLTVKPLYELTELFQIKKFLANYRAVVALLAGHVPDLHLVPACAALAFELDRGGSGAETFFLADCYDAELGGIRNDLAELDTAIRQVRDATEQQDHNRWGIDFDGRDFLVLTREMAAPLQAAPGHFAMEPYDDGAVLVRRLPSAAMVALLERRSVLLAREQQAENRVMQHLSGMVRAAMPGLHSAIEALACWDRARAGAVLALEHGLTRPRLDGVGMVLDQARFMPCQAECLALGLEYTALDARFNAAAVVLFGSNMGGKTVVLKTILFFQLLAQAGLFVPARCFESRIFDHIEYVGALAGERLAGLSGFGLEVWRFTKAFHAGKQTLLAFDELARTTGSHEAEALLSAIVEHVATKGGSTRTFFATHYRGIARLPGVAYLRMRGLDRTAAGMELAADLPLADRLASINRHMRYQLEVDSAAGQEHSDALSIAAMLGLDPAIVGRAEWFFSNTGSGPRLKH